MKIFFIIILGTNQLGENWLTHVNGYYMTKFFNEDSIKIS